MLGLVVSLVASIAPVPQAGGACGDDSDACVLAVVELAVEPAGAERAYATPAVVDCRSSSASPSAPFVLTTLVGECDGSVYDASYRTSRAPEREAVTLALMPAPRERHRALSSCDARPPKSADFTVSTAQPLALSATPSLALAAARLALPAEGHDLTSRFGDPPDKPPRV